MYQMINVLFGIAFGFMVIALAVCHIAERTANKGFKDALARVERLRGERDEWKEHAELWAGDANRGDAKIRELEVEREALFESIERLSQANRTLNKMSTEMAERLLREMSIKTEEEA